MRLLSLLSCICGLTLSLAAQSSLSISGPPVARPGETLNLTLNLSASPTPNLPAGLGYLLGVPSGWTATGAIGPAGISAAKSLYCATGDAFCLIVGMNTNPIQSGTVASYSLQIPASASPGTTPIPVIKLELGDFLGTELTAAAGSLYAVKILSRQDINGDGSVTSADVFLILDMALGKTSCTADQNGDGQCRLIDVLLVINALSPPIA